MEQTSKVSPYFQNNQQSSLDNVKNLGEACTFRDGGTQGSYEESSIPQEVSLKDLNMQVLDCGAEIEDVKSIFDQKAGGASDHHLS